MVRNEGGQSQGQLEKSAKNNPVHLCPVQGEAGTCGAPGIRGGPGEPGDDGPEGPLGRSGEQGKEVCVLADTTVVTAAHRCPLPGGGDGMETGKVCHPAHWLGHRQAEVPPWKEGADALGSPCWGSCCLAVLHSLSSLAFGLAWVTAGGDLPCRQSCGAISYPAPKSQPEEGGEVRARLLTPPGMGLESSHCI